MAQPEGHPHRKVAPHIPNDADDVGLPGISNGSAPVRKPSAKEPTHNEKVDFWKAQNGIRLIIGCLIAIVVLAVVSHFAQRESSEISGAIEVLKVVATTALGFVFGRSASNRDSE